jgi:(p)ppGpp synthase/HD superfamily hydrolase
MEQNTYPIETLYSIRQQAYKVMEEAHRGQCDKGGNHYFLHPFRVSQEVTNHYWTSYFDKFIGECVALLHDVIEDSDITADDLVKEGFEHAIVNRVVRMTRKEGESYMDYIKRIGEDNICRVVKMCDLKDNMDITRLEKITDKDFDRLKKYHKAYKYLKSLG